MLADPPETQGAERGLASAHRLHPIFAQKAVSWCRRLAQFQRSEPRVKSPSRREFHLVQLALDVVAGFATLPPVEFAAE